MWHLHREDGRILSETAAKINVIPGDLLLPNCGINGPNRCIVCISCGKLESDVLQSKVSTKTRRFQMPAHMLKGGIAGLMVQEAVDTRG